MNLLTIPQVQERVKASRSWVVDRIREGTLPAIRRGHKFVRIREEDLTKFLTTLASGQGKAT